MVVVPSTPPLRVHQAPCDMRCMSHRGSHAINIKIGRASRPVVHSSTQKAPNQIIPQRQKIEQYCTRNDPTNLGRFFHQSITYQFTILI